MEFKRDKLQIVIDFEPYVGLTKSLNHRKDIDKMEVMVISYFSFEKIEDRGIL